MKILRLFTATLTAALLLLVGCRSQKTAVIDQPTATQTAGGQDLLRRIDAQAQHGTTYMGSKVKFSITVGDKHVSVGGNLRMKRDDVIRLQLTALGLVEAARMEFTQDYVLLLDRLNKEYIKAPYEEVDFLRDSGINFNTLQALFWNELFQPGKTRLSDDDLTRYTTSEQVNNEVVINYEEASNEKVKGRMLYTWLANNLTARIQNANIMYRDQRKGNTQLDWKYSEFKNQGGKTFPTDMFVTLITPRKELKMGIKLSSMNNDSDWETRTRVSSRYHEVSVDEILKRLMSL